MTEEEKKHYWLKAIGIIIATLIGAFLAFYLVADITFNRMLSPEYNIRRMEKMMRHQEKTFQKLDEKFMDHPFEPKMAPMLVNLVKETNEYKLIVDLKQLGGDEKNVNLKIDDKDNVVTVFGEVEKTIKNNERILNFSQSFYLDDKIDKNNITKEKKGNKYIITIPFED